MLILLGLFLLLLLLALPRTEAARGLLGLLVLLLVLATATPSPIVPVLLGNVFPSIAAFAAVCRVLGCIFVAVHAKPTFVDLCHLGTDAAKKNWISAVMGGQSKNQALQLLCSQQMGASPMEGPTQSGLRSLSPLPPLDSSRNDGRRSEGCTKAYAVSPTVSKPTRKKCCQSPITMTKSRRKCQGCAERSKRIEGEPNRGTSRDARGSRSHHPLRLSDADLGVSANR